MHGTPNLADSESNVGCMHEATLTFQLLVFDLLPLEFFKSADGTMSRLDVKVPEVEVEISSSFLCNSSGGSALHVYASYGAGRLGTKGGQFDVARVFPSVFYTIHRTQFQLIGGCLSIKQFVVALLHPHVCARSSASCTILGGWSLAVFFVFHAVLSLEVCTVSPRAAFVFDARSLVPIYLGSGALGQVISTNRETGVVFAAGARSLIIFAFAEALARRCLSPFLCFVCPFQPEGVMVQDDCTIRARFPLYTMSREDCLLPSASHNTFPINHYWDVARRLRGHHDIAISSSTHAFVRGANAIELPLIMAHRPIQKKSSKLVPPAVHKINTELVLACAWCVTLVHLEDRPSIVPKAR